jgi:recombination protein RecR
MPAPVAGAEVERLIQLLARLPGLGARSARRAALHLIQKREQLLRPLADAMAWPRTAFSSASAAATSTPPTRAAVHR